MKPTEVRCVCGTLFGYTDGVQLQIKHRDLYRIITGGSTEGPCRKCGAMVKWTATKATARLLGGEKGNIPPPPPPRDRA